MGSEMTLNLRTVLENSKENKCHCVLPLETGLMVISDGRRFGPTLALQTHPGLVPGSAMHYWNRHL